MKIRSGRLLLSIIAFVLATISSSAQQTSTIYRGRGRSPFPYKFNGTYYLDSRKFSQGDILYNGKVYRGILLNLDAYGMEVETKPGENEREVILDPSQVVWFTMDGRRFVNLRYLGYDSAPEGFLEIVKDGVSPILRYSRKVSRADASGGATNMEDLDGNYTEGVENYFESSQTWYSLENGILRKISRRRMKNRMKEASNPSESPLREGLLAWHPTEGSAAGILPAGDFKAKDFDLPDDYFSREITDTTSVTYSSNALKATYQNKVYIIGEKGKSSGTSIKVGGTVFEAESGLPLPGVVIFDERTSTYVRSDAEGRYSISLPNGENTLYFNAESKEDLTLRLDVQGQGTLDVVMTENVTNLKGTVVVAESMKEHRTIGMGISTISTQTISKIPSAFGEGDIVKAVLTLPGVKSVGEVSGGFNVRGGSADQNLILYNDNTIYNPSHLFGLLSAFNPDLVEGVELYKSSIPARYGGRISSVLSVESKEGDPNRIKGSLGIGLLTSRAHIEGPLWNGKTTFMAGGRISYSDWMLGLLPKNSSYSGGGAGFADASLSVTHRFDENNSLQLFGYYASDRFSFRGDTTYLYSSINGSVAYRHKGREGRSTRISAGYDNYGNTLQLHGWPTGAYDLETGVQQAFLKGVRTRPQGDHTITWGLDLVGYHLNPGDLRPFGDRSQAKASSLPAGNGIDGALHLSDSWNMTDKFSLEGGVRMSLLMAMEPSELFPGPEFRLSGKYSLKENLSLKAGINTLRQNIHLISNTASISPMDTWMLSGKGISPTNGWQGAAGAYWTHLSSGIDFSFEGYYKRSNNALDYKSGAILKMNPDLVEDLTPVQGRAYGAEFSLKKPAGKLSGWLSYSYSRSMFRDISSSEEDAINHGRWYNAPHDKPHEFKLVGNYAFTHRLSLSMNVDYSTGRPITVPDGKYYLDGAWRLTYSERNRYRIPDYFRVDIAMNIDPGHYLKAFMRSSITIGVYNVTGRKNAYSVFFKPRDTGGVDAYKMSVLASQIPYINLNMLF